MEQIVTDSSGRNRRTWKVNRKKFNEAGLLTCKPNANARCKMLTVNGGGETGCRIACMVELGRKCHKNSKKRSLYYAVSAETWMQKWVANVRAWARRGRSTKQSVQQ